MGMWSRLILGIGCFLPSMVPTAARPAESDGVAQPVITIISAIYGDPAKRRVVDISLRSQELCGRRALSCQIFCSDTSFGRSRVGRRAVCRVTYRCGASAVRSVEAAREELVLMRCADDADTGLLDPVSSNRT